ncbi:MAG: hypothetical protein AAGB12_09855 [Pseudomonadota bacterium]
MNIGNLTANQKTHAQLATSPVRPGAQMNGLGTATAASKPPALLGVPIPETLFSDNSDLAMSGRGKGKSKNGSKSSSSSTHSSRKFNVTSKIISRPGVPHTHNHDSRGDGTRPSGSVPSDTHSTWSSSSRESQLTEDARRHAAASAKSGRPVPAPLSNSTHVPRAVRYEVESYGHSPTGTEYKNNSGTSRPMTDSTSVFDAPLPGFGSGMSTTTSYPTDHSEKYGHK